MTIKLLGDKIRQDLKKRGYTNRDIGIRVQYSGYSMSITATIKNLSIKHQQISDILFTYKEVRYDENSGEILQGANTFVEVKYDWEILESATNSLLPQALKLWEKLQVLEHDEGGHIAETEDTLLLAYPSTRSRDQIGKIQVINKHNNDRQIIRFSCVHQEEIAECLALFTAQHADTVVKTA